MTTTSTRSTIAIAIAMPPKPAFSMGRWLAEVMSARPAPKARADAADFVDTKPLAFLDDDDLHAARGGWHASSLDLAAGLQVIELDRAEAEALMRA